MITSVVPGASVAIAGVVLGIGMWRGRSEVLRNLVGWRYLVPAWPIVPGALLLIGFVWATVDLAGPLSEWGTGLLSVVIGVGVVASAVEVPLAFPPWVRAGLTPLPFPGGEPALPCLIVVPGPLSGLWSRWSRRFDARDAILDLDDEGWTVLVDGRATARGTWAAVTRVRGRGTSQGVVELVGSDGRPIGPPLYVRSVPHARRMIQRRRDAAN